MSIALTAKRYRVARLILRWRRDRSGVTAIEFAIVAIPFLLFMYGIIAIGLFFYTTFAV